MGLCCWCVGLLWFALSSSFEFVSLPADVLSCGLSHVSHLLGAYEDGALVRCRELCTRSDLFFLGLGRG